MEIGLCMSDKLFTFCLSTRKAAQYYTRYHLMGFTLEWAVEKESHLVFLWWYKAGNSFYLWLWLVTDKPEYSKTSLTFRIIDKLPNFSLAFSYSSQCFLTLALPVDVHILDWEVMSEFWTLVDIIYNYHDYPALPSLSSRKSKVTTIITSIMMLLPLTRLWVVKDDEPHRATAAGFRTVCVNTGD